MSNSYKTLAPSIVIVSIVHAITGALRNPVEGANMLLCQYRSSIVVHCMALVSSTLCMFHASPQNAQRIDLFVLNLAILQFLNRRDCICSSLFITR